MKVLNIIIVSTFISWWILSYAMDWGKIYADWTFGVPVTILVVYAMIRAILDLTLGGKE